MRIAADLPDILALDGAPVVWGRHRTRGIVSRVQVMQDDGRGLQVPVWETTLLVVDGTLPGITVDQVVTVAGERWAVRRVGRPDDGGGLSLTVARA